LKAYTYLLFLLFSSFAASSQTVTGEWFGIGNVHWAGEHNSYLSELNLKQVGNKVTGTFSYYFRSANVTLDVTGTYNPKTRTVELNARPMLNYQAKDVNGADCPMEGSFTLRTSRLETSLIGQFNPTYAYRYTCPPITIKFKKEQPGQEKEPLPTPEIAREESPLEKLFKETFKEPAPDTTAPMVTALVRRAFDIVQVIDVDADSLKVSLYDNGDVDNDTISLFYNRKLVAHKKMLSQQPLTFTLPVDTAINELAMYAENLGGIPPNTAVAIIYAGKERFELFMTSTFIKNSTIRFRKKPAIAAAVEGT
jgi:hypothetical protein